MKDDKNVNDAELHAYVDGQLDKNQRRQIEKDLDNDPQAREKLTAYQDINQALHRLYDPMLEERIPSRLLPVASKQRSYVAAFASLFFFIFGILFGWQARLNMDLVDAGSSSTDMNLVQPAVFAHSVYAVEVAHPVEVSAREHKQLDKWLSRRLKTTLTAPNLTRDGYKLIGGRLLPSTEYRMAAQYMYENNNGNRITLYVRRGKWDHESTAINYSQQKGYSMFYWTEDDMGYALTSALKKDQYQDLAKEVYKQMNLNPEKPLS